MYVPLPLKYRPKHWSSLIGQDVIVQIIRNMLKSNRLIPSIIFGGSRGTGKTTSARILARTLNCEQINEEDYEPCGACDSCTDIDNETSFAVQEMDAASHGLVDDVRRIKEEVRYADDSKYRVYIIDECHSLTTNAWQAFLKLLEEPPPGVIFAFCTTEVHKIPETIISRSMSLPFARMTAEIIKKRLHYIATLENIKVEEGVFHEIAKHVNGGMRDAISLLDQLVSFTNNSTITVDHVTQVVGTVNVALLFDIYRALISSDVKGLYECLQMAYAEVSDVSVLVRDLIMFYRDMLMVKVEVGIKDGQADYVTSLNQSGQAVTVEYLLEAQNQLHFINEQMRRSTLPARTVMDVYITKLFYGGIRSSQVAIPQTTTPRAVTEKPSVLNPSQIAEGLEGVVMSM